MTGAGSGQAVFQKGTAFNSYAATYYRPGRNINVEELNLQRTLQRLRTPSNAEAVNSLAGNLEGAFSVSYGMNSDRHGDVRDIVFNSGGTGFTTGQAPTSRWFVGTKFLDTSQSELTAERVLESCIPLEYAITYQQGTNEVRETLTMGYANEADFNSSFSPGSVSGVTSGNEVAQFGTTLTIDNTTVSRLQSCTLRFSNLYRYLRDPSPYAVEAVLANPTVTLETNAIIHTTDYLSYAYNGTTSGTSPDDRIAQISNSDLAFDVGGTVLVRYNLSNLKPDTSQWNAIADPDTDTNEDMTWQVTGTTSIATS